MSMNIQRKNSAHHFRMQSEREQTLVVCDVAITLVHSEKTSLKKMIMIIIIITEKWFTSKWKKEM